MVGMTVATMAEMMAATAEEMTGRAAREAVQVEAMAAGVTVVVGLEALMEVERPVVIRAAPKAALLDQVAPKAAASLVGAMALCKTSPNTFLCSRCRSCIP